MKTLISVYILNPTVKKLALLVASLMVWLTACFDEPAQEALCYDRRATLEAEAEEVQLIVQSSIEANQRMETLTLETTVDAILDLEEKRYRQIIEDRELSCAATMDFADHCSAAFPIFSHPLLEQALAPSFFRSPWLYLIGKQEVSEVVTACDLIYLDDESCFTSDSCEDHQSCIALSTEVPTSEPLLAHLSSKMTLPWVQLTERFCPPNQSSCTRCLSSCKSDNDCDQLDEVSYCVSSSNEMVSREIIGVCVPQNLLL